MALILGQVSSRKMGAAAGISSAHQIACLTNSSWDSPATMVNGNNGIDWGKLTKDTLNREVEFPDFQGRRTARCDCPSRFQSSAKQRRRDTDPHACLNLKGLVMTMTLNEILPLTREMDLADRAKLAEQLLTSLDDPSEAEVEKLWIEEAKRRLAAYRAGQVETIPAEEVFRQALADLG